jgi:hypothetical protein
MPVYVHHSPVTEDQASSERSDAAFELPECLGLKIEYGAVGGELPDEVLVKNKQGDERRAGGGGLHEGGVVRDPEIAADPDEKWAHGGIG